MNVGPLRLVPEGAPPGSPAPAGSPPGSRVAVQSSIRGVSEATPSRPGSSGKPPQRLRIIEALLDCVASYGLAKTTVDDIARAAGCSRATVYRVFPEGKDSIMRAAVDTEVSRLFASLALVIGQADSLEEVLVSGMVEAARLIGDNRVVTYLLEHEPGVVLPYLAFDEMDRLLERASSFAAPFLGQWLGLDDSVRVAEWVTRIMLSYLVCPAEYLRLSDRRSVERFVRTFVLPGIRALQPDLHLQPTM
ncbi:MAG: TetR/AcrR family transcriptional regulator [Acidimicrobiales bacterium]